MEKKFNFFSKEFFAAHFNIPIERLGEWGIKVHNDELTPVLLIKNSSNFVNLSLGIFETMEDLPWITYKVYPAKVTNGSLGLCFTAVDLEGEEVSLNMMPVYFDQIYSRRWYLPGTEEVFF